MTDKMFDALFDVLLEDKTKYVVYLKKARELYDTTNILANKIAGMGLLEVLSNNSDEEPRLVKVKTEYIEKTEHMLTKLLEELETLKNFVYGISSICDVVKKDEFTIAEITALIKDKYQLLPVPILIKEFKKLMILAVEKEYLIPLND